MKKVLLTIVDGTKNNAAPKAKEDVIKFLEPEGYTSIKIQMNFHSKLQKIWETNFHLQRLMKNNEIDELIFQFPAYSFYLMKRFVKYFRRYHQNAKLIFIVHDVESLRQNSDGTYDSDERDVLNASDGLIVHNSKMEEYLRGIGVNSPMALLQIFDYDNPQPIIENSKLTNSVCFAGNLAKAQFLSTVKGSYHLNVYGPNPGTYKLPVVYKGVYSPEELPKHLDGSFGLVWDGTSSEECNGIYGHYLKFNNPHKTSLYISSGLPVIVWDQSAMADYIIHNNLGIAINNLNELPIVLKSMTIQQYQVMKENVLAKSEELRHGVNIKYAVHSIREKIYVD